MTDSVKYILILFDPMGGQYDYEQTNQREGVLVTKTLLQHTAQSDRHLSVLLVSFSESEVAFVLSKIQLLLGTCHGRCLLT